MNYVKAKFLKGDKLSGRAYTYRCEAKVETGDMVTDAKGSKLVVVDEPVDMAWVETYGADKVAVVKKYVEQEVVVKNWSLFCDNDNGFTAPELLHHHLQGNVYGRTGFNDGDPINTSRIVGIEDKGDHKVVVTRTGSRYSVYPADVDPECEKQFPGYYERLSLKLVNAGESEE